MTGPRSTAIRLEAAALDAQTRANMQNLLLEVLAIEGKTVMLISIPWRKRSISPRASWW